MPPEPSTHPEESALVIRPSTALVILPEGGSPALSEIISRSLAHIQASNSLGMFHRIGEHELCGPDYRLVCAFAEDLRLPPEEVLRRLLLPGSGHREDIITEIEDGRFKDLRVDWNELPISSIPSIEGLVVERLDVRGRGLAGLQTILGPDFSIFPHLTVLWCTFNQLTELDLSQVPHLTELWCGQNKLTQLDLSQVPNLTNLECDSNELTELDLSQVPHLTTLWCTSNPLTELDLSQVPHLTELGCSSNELTELDLSQVPNLTELWCYSNQLTELDLSQVPNLTTLDCNNNQLTELDLSQVPNLKCLWYSNNQLTELDIRNLRNLEFLDYDEHDTRLIQRPDQNF